MKILIASFSFPVPSLNIFDGKFVLAEAKAYADAGATVQIITPYIRGARQVEWIGKGFLVRRFSYFSPKSLQVLKNPGSPLYNQKSFLARIQIPFLCFFYTLAILRHATYFDIIHAQWTLSALLSLPAKWLFKKKIVLTARGSDLRLLPKKLNRYIHRKVDGAIDCFGPQPRNIEYKKTYTAKYLRLPLLVDCEIPSNIPEDMKRLVEARQNPFIILYVGRFDRFKLSMQFPIINLIKASGMLKEWGMTFQVIYIGDGETSVKQEMISLRREYGVMDEVAFLGPRMNVLPYMHICHIGSGGSAFNAVSQEFTISGKAQILVDTPSNRNTPWRHGRNALFVRAEDVKDLADKIRWAMQNRHEIETIGKNAKQDMSPYIVDGRVGGPIYLEAFKKLIDSQGPEMKVHRYES